MRLPPLSPGVLPESWRVELPTFAGPLDLLLHLIRINEVEITDIPVARICEQFHAYLALMEELDLDVAGEYIYEAAMLIVLKSKMLLPRPASAAGEPVVDPREDLVARLLEYRRLKNAAQTLAEVDRLRQGIWTRRGEDLDELRQPEAGDAEFELGDVSLFDLLGAFKGVLSRFDREHPAPMLVSTEVYTVRSQVERLLGVLSAAAAFDLLADLRARSCRAEAIACFLAVLELARLSLVRVHQTASGELLLYRTTRELDVADLETVHG